MKPKENQYCIYKTPELLLSNIIEKQNCLHETPQRSRNCPYGIPKREREREREKERERNVPLSNLK
jgi:hypothetical protein